MPLPDSALPFATTYDPVEDPPGSIDPLGTAPLADRLADTIFPGMTARMWRARLLTFTAVAGFVADAVADGEPDGANSRVAARLAFERLFVTSVAAAEKRDPIGLRAARMRLPGINMAHAALASGQPLTAENFLKAQVINGPVGVMARLARATQLVTDDMAPSRNAPPLVGAWADERDLRGFLEEAGSSPGRAWLQSTAGYVSDWTAKKRWPSLGTKVWSQLLDTLRVDQIGTRERKALIGLLRAEPARRRMLGLVSRSAHEYRTIAAETSNRGAVERSVFLEGVVPRLGDDPLDRQLRFSIEAIDISERLGCALQAVFETVLWALTRQATFPSVAALIAFPGLRAHLEARRAEVARCSEPMKAVLEKLKVTTGLGGVDVGSGLSALYEAGLEGERSVEALVTVVMGRHKSIQGEKGKPPWIGTDAGLVVRPGFGFAADEPPAYDSIFLHPYRLTNAVWFLRDLGEMNVEAGDE
jgi:hypothetical protein